MKAFLHAIEILGIFGILGVVPFIAWTKMSMGAVLALAGTFFAPVNDRSNSNPRGGNLSASVGDAHFHLSGTLRFLLVVGGVILLTSAALDSKDPVLEEASRKLGYKQSAGTYDNLQPHVPQPTDDLSFHMPFHGLEKADDQTLHQPFGGDFNRPRRSSQFGRLDQQLGIHPTQTDQQ